MPDYPDGMQHVNIAAQDIAELTQRPKYGAFRQVSYAGAILPDESPTLFSISGKGIIYGGYLFSINTTESHASDVTLIQIDGTITHVVSFTELNDRNLDSNWNEIFYLKKFDDINWEYVESFSQGITFETGFSIRYYNLLFSPSNVTVTSYLYYALT